MVSVDMKGWYNMDEMIKAILSSWKEEVNVQGVIQYKLSFTTRELTIFTSKPGYFIGKAGCHVDKYLKMLKEKHLGIESIKFQEVDSFVI
jgi:ribosomal protein S3